MSVAFVYGTRPEIIKLAPIIRLLGDQAFLVNTGQHFDYELSNLIAEDSGVSSHSESLGIGASTRARQIGMGLIGAESVIGGCEAVIVQGDTNSALAGGLAANALETPLFHVEAGLRSFDRRMPEEHNRVVVDHLADVCWAPTQANVENLLNEGISDKRIILTGNPVVEALNSALPSEDEINRFLQAHRVRPRQFALATLHRPENVDEPGRLRLLLESLSRLPIPVVLPMHPRTAATIESFGIKVSVDSLHITGPVGYRQFLALMSAAALVVSDSGGVQEEVSVLKVPLVVVRRSTERPEVIGTFASITDDSDEMLQISNEILAKQPILFEELAQIPSPYGDGLASQRIVDSLKELVGS